MVKIYKDNVKNVTRKGKMVLVAGMLAATLTLSGCIPTEVSSNSKVVYDVIDTSDIKSLNNGLTQIIDVPGENFKIVVTYKCELQEGEKWMVTADKKINTEIYTEGLNGNTEVYIDNIHTDTTICSYYPVVNGITQDTMDDRIHNAQMLGFPISDTNSYVGINQIEGQNETFIKGTCHGFNGYSSGSYSEKRRVESDYLQKGVYANKVSSIIDLIVVENNQMRTVSIPSEIQISVWPFIEKVHNNGQRVFNYYYYDKEKNTVVCEELSELEYLKRTEVSKPKSLTKQKNHKRVDL